MPALIERASCGGSFIAHTQVANSGYVNLTNTTGIALRSTVSQTLTLYAAEKRDGTYTIANDAAGSPITIVLIANQWRQVNVNSFPYTHVKFQAGTSTQSVEFIGKG